MDKPNHRPARGSAPGPLVLIDAAGLATVAALSLGAYLFGVEPMRQAERAEKDRVAFLVERTQEAERAEAEARRFRETLSEVEGDLDAVPLRIEPVERLNQRLARLAELAEAAPVRVDDLTPGKGVEDRGGVRVPIRLGGVGDYASCVAFLVNLRRAMPDVNVMGLEVTGPGEEEGAVGRFWFDLAWHAAAVDRSAHAGERGGS